MALRHKAVFLDKDGTLIHDVPFNVDPDKMVLTPRACEGLMLLQQEGYSLHVITNQPGVAQGLFNAAALDAVEDRLRELLRAGGVHLDGFFYCPHSPQGIIPALTKECGCRKPLPGLLNQAAHERSIDLSRSWMIGDILNDVEAGCRAGCRTVLINNGNETEWTLSPHRMPDLIACDLYHAACRIIKLDQATMQIGRQTPSVSAGGTHPAPRPVA